MLALSRDSTVNQLLNITDKLSETLDRGKEARMIFLDAAKAFDRVWHEGVLFKLEQLGVDKVFVNWFASYLRNRQQRVVIMVQCPPCLRYRLVYHKALF